MSNLRFDLALGSLSLLEIIVRLLNAERRRWMKHGETCMTQVFHSTCKMLSMRVDGTEMIQGVAERVNCTRQPTLH